ncbi:MAG: hypothetical protein FWH47_02335 [Methanomassiliicoccaceae archaeon]|nr:hypothetical protein [Methanomassiliicoccaceae archaeon]
MTETSPLREDGARRVRLPDGVASASLAESIADPSGDFLQFLHDYFTGDPVIRWRVEEDIGVWERMKGEELEAAKRLIIDNLGVDPAYMRAIAVFRDERGIPLLEGIARLPAARGNEYVRLYAAKILYEWVGYEPYPRMLEATLPKGGSPTKTHLDMWVHGIDDALAARCVVSMLRDRDGFVRWCAYCTAKRRFGIRDGPGRRGDDAQDMDYNENMYYTDDSVYSDKALFEARLKELEARIYEACRPPHPGV